MHVRLAPHASAQYCSFVHASAVLLLPLLLLLLLLLPLQAALRAREAGSTRFCMGAAWRGPSQVGPRQWERVLEMVRRIRGLGMEVRSMACCMLCVVCLCCSRNGGRQHVFCASFLVSCLCCISVLSVLPVGARAGDGASRPGAGHRDELHNVWLT
jgi:hypothetical protein